MKIPSNISLLYVEDESGIRNSVSRSLSLISDNIHSSENGVDALDYLHKNKVDLIITDIRMPKMDGLSFVDKLRHEEIDIPVIITSAFNETEYLTKAIELKVDKFINKPIRIQELLDMVSKLAETIANKRLLELKQQELQHYREAVEKTSLQIKLRGDGSIVSKNKDLCSFLNMQGVSDEHINTLSDLFNTQDTMDILEAASNMKVYNKTLSFTLKDTPFTVVTTAFASIIEDDDIQEITILLNDVTPIIREKEKIIHELHYDELTGLPNRAKLFKDLAYDEDKKAILIVDINDFAHMNQLYGFESGDSIIKQMANILKEYWPDERKRTVYRNDADRFIILTQKMEEFKQNKAKNIAQKLIDKIQNTKFFLNNNLQVIVDVTIGGSCEGSNDLLTEALISLDVAKSTKKNFLCFKELTGIKESIKSNLNIQRSIKHALEQDLIINYYQPIVDADAKLEKYETLVRMKDPANKNKILSPVDFLDISRESKNYPLITRSVIKNAFRDFGDSSVPFSINLSYDDISNPDTTFYLEQKLKEHLYTNVTIEILESEGLQDLDKTIRFIEWMKGYGCKIAIDDFGSGYSNFSYFFDMPLDILKIDGSLIRRIHEYRAYVTLEGIVKFAKNLGIKTVAEYVEDESIFEKLKTLDITMYQGYHFSAPKPYEELNLKELADEK